MPQNFILILTLFSIQEPTNQIEPDHHIAGGRAVKLGEYPMIVGIRMLYIEVHVCLGVLFADQYALTAAHCLYKLLPCQASYELLAGDVDLKQKPDSPKSRQIIGLDFCSLHPKFNNVTLEDDIALMKLTFPVKNSENVQQRADLRSPRPIGMKCEIVGSADDSLFAKRVQILSDNICHSTFESYRPKKTICVGNLEAGQSDTYPGDSGSLLICKGIVYGVASFKNRKLPIKEAIGGYTDLSFYKEWINAEMRNISQTFKGRAERLTQKLNFVFYFSWILWNNI